MNNKTRILIIVSLVLLTVSPFIAVDTIGRIRQNRLRTQFVYDFDYMLYLLEENFPLFGIIERRNGVNMLELGRELRDHLAYEADRNIISHEYFWSLLRDEFFDMAFPVGHLRLVSDAERDMTVQYIIDIPIIDNTAGVGRFVDVYLNAPRYGFRREHWEERPNAQLSPDDTLYTRIFEEGRIAYLGVNGFQRHISQEHLSFIDNFYREIAGFEHLIIDIRGPEGGMIYFFNELIAAPLIDRIQTVDFHHFLKGGEFNLGQFSLLHAVSLQSTDNINLNSLFSEQLSDELIADIANTDFYFIQQHRIHPRSPRANFNGKIWMLVDEYVFSGDQWVAAAYKDMGFITLVGETTGGMLGSFMHYVEYAGGTEIFMLPNSGFIVRFDNTLMLDSTGRPVEYGTKPHFFNRPGLNALETVLQMIYEGEY